MRFFVLLPLSTVLLLATALGCGGGASFRGGTFRDSDVTYHLDPPGPSWQRAKFSGNDLAWTHPVGHVIAVNSECRDTGDPSLKVLTNHLLIGFEDRQVVEREEFPLDGRGALRTHVATELDGVPVEMELTVLKKDGCVYDFIYTSPRGRFGEAVGDYRTLVKSFHTEARHK